MRAATFFDGDGWREGVAELVDGNVRLRDAAPPPQLPRLDGVVIGGFTDHHVHLQLVDHTLLAGSRLGRVVDLGGDPAALRELAGRFVSLRSLNDRSQPARTPGDRTAPADQDRTASGDHDRVSLGDGEASGDRDRVALGDRDRTASDDRTASSFHGNRLLSEERSDETKRPRAVEVDFAGAFLTAPGGYPSDRDWAPEGSFREISDADSAAAAVAEMADAGASCIKVTSNSTAGPVLPDDLFRAIVGLAADRALPVVAHAEGRGQAARAVRLGAARLAHAPFTEHLDDDEIARQAASASWISTLAIHDDPARAIAIDNVRRFRAAGGTVLYGTDLGNGPMPVDLNPREIAALREAGLDDAALLTALAPIGPLDRVAAVLFLPHASPVSADPLDARPLTPADLKV